MSGLFGRSFSVPTGSARLLISENEKNLVFFEMLVYVFNKSQ